MNKQFFGVAIACCLLALLAAAPTRAQLPGSAARVTIPFDFIVRGKTLPAGEYTIKRINDSPEGLVIGGVHNRARAMFVTQPVQTRRTPKQGELVFHRFGDSYFLREVWTVGEDTGRELPPSRAEREFRRQLAGNNLAQPQTVALAY